MNASSGDEGGGRGRPRVRIAVVGCGYIGQAEHIPCLLAARDLELAAIVEPRPRTREALAERLAVPAFAILVREGAPNPCTVADALRDLELIARIREAAAR